MTRFYGLGLVAAAVTLAIAACSSDSGDDAATNDGGVVVPPATDGGGGDDGAPPPPTRSEFGLDTRPANTTCKTAPRPPSTAKVAFQQVFTNVNLQLPMVLAQIPGDSSRWYVAQRGTADGANATIVSFPTTSPPNTPTQVATVGPLALTGGEGGLLGMAFHPKFAQNGKLFVSFTKQDAGGPKSEVAVLTSTDGGATFGNLSEIFSFVQSSASNHKGGCVQFGKDGFLYASFGDGGNQDDFFKNGQNLNGFFAKIHRIDVDNPSGGKPYSIPDGNPFKNGGGQDTIYSRGHRNPFRFSFDRESGQLWVGDVGGSD